MESLYNFNLKAYSYDAYYESPLGKQIDIEEKNCVKKFLDKISQRKILELGSGTGHWTKWLSEEGFTVHAIDIAEEMMAIAKQKNIPNSSFEIMSMTNLKFTDNSIDNIIAITSLEFSVDLARTFSEIKRVLKPQGHFIAAVLNSKSTIGINKNKNTTFANANFFTKEELLDRMKKIGSPKICKAAFLNEKFEVIEESENSEPAMFVASAVNTI